MLFRGRSLTFLLLSALTLSGCYSGYYLTSAGPGSAGVRDYSKSIGSGGFPVYISSATERSDDERENGLSYALSRSLESTGLYSAVSVVPPQGDFIEARLSTKSLPHEDEQTANTVKMVLTGASFFLLSGALPQTHHFDADYTLDIIWPNRTTSRYKTHCGAYSYATIDKYRDVQDLAKQLQQTTCLNSVTNQMSLDYSRMVKGAVYRPPQGVTTGQLTQWGRTKNPNQAKPEAVCAEVGLTPGTRSYDDCLSEMK